MDDKMQHAWAFNNTKIFKKDLLGGCTNDPSFSILSFPKNNKKTNKNLSPLLVPINDAHKEISIESSSPQDSSPNISYSIEDIPIITTLTETESENHSLLPKSHLDTDFRVATTKVIRSSSQTNILQPNSFNRHQNRSSMFSSNVSTKPNNIVAARKHSLPPVMDLFESKRQIIQPFMTLAEFKKSDEFPRQQRAILAALQRQEIRLRKDGVIKEMNKATLRGKRGERKSKTKEKETVTIRSSIPVIRRGSSVAALKFLGIKKGKKRTTSVLLNNLTLAIRDHKTSDALVILSQISNNALKKKKNSDVNKSFLLAMANRLEDITLAMFERGFPSDVNSPIFSKPTKNAERGGISGLKFPSYFILAVALGLHGLVKVMLKRANMNQTWFGLTPLIIATSQSSRTPAIDRHSSDSNATSNITLIIKLFLDHGADPSQGLPFEQFNTLRRLKAKEYMRRMNILNSFNSIDTSNDTNKIVSVPHRFCNMGLNAKKTKEEIEKFSRGKWVLPIDIAAVSGNIDIVKILLSRMEASNIASSSFCLSLQSDVMLTLEFAHAGANVNQMDIRGSTALHRAARSGHIEMVVVLLQLGADVNAKDENDWAPLHEAISQKHLNVCPILVAAGADLHITNNFGKTPKDLGIDCGLTLEQIEQCLDAVNNTHIVHKDNEIMINQKNYIANGTQFSKNLSLKRFGTFPRKSQNITSILMGGS
ncbi:14209_t:CDS:2, partial [Funneliformis geosporum]